MAVILCFATLILWQLFRPAVPPSEIPIALDGQTVDGVDSFRLYLNDVDAQTTPIVLAAGAECVVRADLRIDLKKWYWVLPRRPNTQRRPKGDNIGKPVLEVKISIVRGSVLNEVEAAFDYLTPKIDHSGTVTCDGRLTVPKFRGRYHARLEVGKMPQGYPGKRGVDYPVFRVITVPLEIRE